MNISRSFTTFFALFLISFCVPTKQAMAQPETGANMKRMTFNQTTDFAPTWDPRGGTIAYVRLKDGTTSIFDAYKVDSSNQGGEQPLLTGLTTDFGVAVGLSWIGKSGFLAVEEAISGFEVLNFNTLLAPFNRTIANGADQANALLLSIDGGGGGSLTKISRDGSTALIRFSTTGSSGNISIRVGPVSSMTGQVSSSFGTAIISENAGGDSRYLNGGALSPDGSNLVLSYSTVQSSTAPHDLFYGSVGGTLLNLTDSSAQSITNIQPDISPDGTQIVFARGTNGTGNSRDLYLIDIDGTGLTQLTDTPNFSENYPSWSPDGSSIAFSGIHTGSTSEVPALMVGEEANSNIYIFQLPAATSGNIVTPKTTLTDPPFVEVENRNVTFTFVPFTKAEKKAATNAIMQRAKKPVKYTFKYNLEIKKDGAKKKDTISKSSKRNELTVKNLKPGSYSARYRVEIFKKENGRTVPQGKTKFSPSAAFTVIE